MLVAAILMVVGIGTVAALSQSYGYRLGGVMVLPMLAIYTFREPLSPVIFVAGTLAAWGTLWAVREYTLNHGRRVFLLGVVASVVGTTLTVAVLALFTPVHLPFDDAEVAASIFPGVAAYNVMRLDRADRLRDILASSGLFAGLLVLGVAALAFLEGQPNPTEPVLALPTSDLVTWLGIESRGEPITKITPNWLTVALLVVDIGVYEWVRKRYDLRLAGIIVVPLLAVFSARLEHAAAIFAVGTIGVFVVISNVHWLSLLYGRVLLGLSLVLGTLYALVLDLLVNHGVPGLTLFFLGLFVGVAAYNLSRVAPRVRSANLRLSAALFVVLYAVLWWAVDVPPGGLLHEVELAYALVGLAVLGLAVVELVRLERSRPSPGAFAHGSVFADVEGADATNSPLVGERGRRASVRTQSEKSSSEDNDD